MRAEILSVEPSTHRPHPLHAPERTWPLSNCYIDLWIELLHALGHVPEAALAVTVAQDFEGDQFTFFKFPAEDLEALFGITVQELALYDAFDSHVLEQLRRGRPVLAEVDAFYLPDAQGTSYRREHVKTTVGMMAIDLAARQLGYFHNGGCYQLDGEDYEGLFRPLVAVEGGPGQVYFYAEFAKLAPARALAPDALLGGSLTLLRRHLRCRPEMNPITAYRSGFERHAAGLKGRPLDYFHVYAFNTLRQLGANFGLLGSYAGWLEGQGEVPLAEVREACERLAADAKALQFQLARAVSRRNFADYSAIFDRLEEAYDTALSGLAARYG